jgi:hypothetical protein
MFTLLNDPIPSCHRILCPLLRCVGASKFSCQSIADVEERFGSIPVDFDEGKDDGSPPLFTGLKVESR